MISANSGSTPVKRLNLALQGGGSHGAYTWGALEALIEREDLEIVGVSGASAGAMNAVVLAAGLLEGGREGARRKLHEFWLAVSGEGSLPKAERGVVDVWLNALTNMISPFGWFDALSRLPSPYAFNPMNFNLLEDLVKDTVDFARLRAGASPQLFIAATNVRTGKGEVFRRGELTADHVMASACLPQLFQAVEIDGAPYWDGGFSGNPPLWPLFYETDCQDTLIIEIDPIERDATPRTSEEISDRMNEITFNASLLAELRAAHFVARLIESGALQDPNYRLQRLHRVGGEGRLESFNASSKLDANWTLLTTWRDLGRAATTKWLAENFDAIGVCSTLDVPSTLRGRR
ncbi:MAG: patatin-like phospholipase family protein [Roseiarcus sp.]